MRAKLVQDIVPAQYKTVGTPITVAAKIPRGREELRAGLVKRDGEEAPRIQIGVFEIEPDGKATIKRTSGFCLRPVEAQALTDALHQLLTDL